MANIEEEIVRLIRKIAEDEEDIRRAEKYANAAYGEEARSRFNEEAKIFGRSLERKIDLLKILKNQKIEA